MLIKFCGELIGTLAAIHNRIDYLRWHLSYCLFELAIMFATFFILAHFQVQLYYDNSRAFQTDEYKPLLQIIFLRLLVITFWIALVWSFGWDLKQQEQSVEDRNSYDFSDFVDGKVDKKNSRRKKRKEIVVEHIDFNRNIVDNYI